MRKKQQLHAISAFCSACKKKMRQRRWDSRMMLQHFFLLRDYFYPLHPAIWQTDSRLRPSIPWPEEKSLGKLCSPPPAFACFQEHGFFAVCGTLYADRGRYISSWIGKNASPSSSPRELHCACALLLRHEILHVYFEDQFTRLSFNIHPTKFTQQRCVQQDAQLPSFYIYTQAFHFLNVPRGSLC